MRGTEEQFNQIILLLSSNIQKYDTRALKYIQYADQVDAIFAGYGWNKKEFYAELNLRLGNKTNDKKPIIKKPVKKRASPKKKPTVVDF